MSVKDELSGKTVELREPFTVSASAAVPWRPRRRRRPPTPRRPPIRPRPRLPSPPSPPGDRRPAPTRSPRGAPWACPGLDSCGIVGSRVARRPNHTPEDHDAKRNDLAATRIGDTGDGWRCWPCPEPRSTPRTRTVSCASSSSGPTPTTPTRVGGTMARYVALGHTVKFVSLTNGDAGHQSIGGGPLARDPHRGGDLRRRGDRLRVHHPRQPRRRAHADPRDAEAGHHRDPRVQAGHGLHPAGGRLPSRPPGHRGAGAGRGLHGHGAERGGQDPAPGEEPDLRQRRGPLLQAHPLRPRDRRRHRRGDREEGGHVPLPHLADVRVAALQPGRARRGAGRRRRPSRLARGEA